MEGCDLYISTPLSVEIAIVAGPGAQVGPKLAKRWDGQICPTYKYLLSIFYMFTPIRLGLKIKYIDLGWHSKLIFISPFLP